MIFFFLRNPAAIFLEVVPFCITVTPFIENMLFHFALFLFRSLLIWRRRVERGLKRDGAGKLPRKRRPSDGGEGVEEEKEESRSRLDCAFRNFISCTI